MSNLALQLDPQYWRDFKFHSREAKRLRHFLEGNPSDFPPAITVSGFTGTGKGAAVRLFLRAALCPNRKTGESELCGECEVCRSDPRTSNPTGNWFWVQRGQDATLAEQFKKVIAEAFRPPNGFAADHLNRKFVVFDELQSVPRDRLQDLLFYPELPCVIERTKVTFIFITMEEERVDPTTLKALVDRTFYMRFRQLQDHEIASYIQEKFPSMPDESVELITKRAGGSIRSALAAIDSCKIDDPYFHPVSVAETLYYATRVERLKLYEMLRMCRFNANYYREINEWWKQNSGSIDPHQLIQQIFSDIDKAMCNHPHQDHLFAKDILYRYLTSTAPLRPLDVLKMLAGKDLAEPDDLSPETPNGYQRVFSQ
jgi:DNA polymerase III gamma/tau subunit